MVFTTRMLSHSGRLIKRRYRYIKNLLESCVFSMFERQGRKCRDWHGTQRSIMSDWLTRPVWQLVYPPSSYHCYHFQDWDYLSDIYHERTASGNFLSNNRVTTLVVHEFKPNRPHLRSTRTTLLRGNPEKHCLEHQTSVRSLCTGTLPGVWRITHS